MSEAPPCPQRGAVDEVTAALPRLDWIWVFAFYLVYVLAGAHTTIATDTARDLIAAWDIVQGVEFPLRGPQLYTTWTLGPIWYYLLALPLWLTQSAALAAVLVALLAGLKFPLAYRLGAEFGGPRTARLGLLAIAMPGWWMFEWLVTSHTNLAATCLLGYALCLLRWSRGAGAGSLVAAALLFSLSVHAHPTSLFWGWLLLAALWSRRGLLGSTLWLHLVLAFAAFMLPFVPMLIDEARTGWPMLTGTRDFVTTRDSPSPWSRLQPFLVALIAVDGKRMAGQFLPELASLRATAVLLLAAPWLLALCGMFSLRKPLQFRAFAVVAVIAGSLFVLWLRPEVPYWMVYASTPGLAVLLTLGWQSALEFVPAQRRGVADASLLALVAGLFLVFAGSRWNGAAEAWVKVPYRVVGDYSDRNQQIDASVPNGAYPVAGQERWVRWLCAQSHDMSVHGDGASMLRMTQGALRALHCADDRHWQLGGDQGEAVALYPMFALRAVGLTPQQRFGGMGRVQVAAIVHSAQAQTDDLVRAYPPWPLTQQADQEMTLTIAATGAGVIAVSNLRVVFNGLEAPELVLDGQRVPPLARSAATWFFNISGGGAGTLRVRSGDLRWIEVLLISENAPG